MSRGHNNPPSMIDLASETVDAINEWMKEHPVVQNEEEAREAKAYLDRAKLCVKDIEAERTQKVAPLNKQVKEINDSYRGPKDLIQKVLNEIEERIASFLEAEERRRREELEKTRIAAQEAEAAAREAERIEQERIDAARSGELGVDIAESSREADRAFADFERASRFVARAERDARVKVGGGFNRSIALKTVEILILTDAHKAISAMGVTDDIREAILKSARAYRRAYEELPDGVEIQTERKL